MEMLMVTQIYKKIDQKAINIITNVLIGTFSDPALFFINNNKKKKKKISHFVCLGLFFSFVMVSKEVLIIHFIFQL